ncbi:MAG: hypothetical protein ABIA76_00410 [Candidatus Diapherotrites archaeon]
MEKQKKVIEFAAGKNILLNQKTAELLSEKENFEEIIDEFVKENKFIISEKDLEKKLQEKKNKNDSAGNNNN